MSAPVTVEQMAEKEPKNVTCPNCSSRPVGIVSRKDNYRPRSHTGNLKTDLTPISTSVTYKCQDQNCGHEWSETTPL
jgi:DNA-directed RNA polymerase subunit RPC12/RpoP